MRTTHRFAQRLAAGVLAVAMLGLATRATAADQEGIQRFAKVIKVKNAKWSPDGGKSGWNTLAVGTLLSPGSEIRTATDGEVDMRLGEAPVNLPARLGVQNPAAAVVYNPQETGQNLIKIYGDSDLLIEKLIEMEMGVEKASETKLNLKAGKILGDVKKLSASSKYEVTLPTGVAGIRGSTYVMSADGTVTMLTGSAVIAVTIQIPGTTQSITQTITINAGESFNANAFITAVQAAATGLTPADKVASAQAAATAIVNAGGQAPGTGSGSLVNESPATIAGLAAAAGALGAVDAGSPAIVITAKDNTVIYVSPK